MFDDALVDRVMRDVQFDPNGGCWLWERATTAGYGHFALMGVEWKAHRAIWTGLNGPIPDGLSACHKCDVPACVNPDHLFLGTHQENMKDMGRKGRAGLTRHPQKSALLDRSIPRAKGQKHSQAKLSDDDVREILGSSEKQQELADRFRVTQTTISKIRLRKSWSHLEIEK